VTGWDVREVMEPTRVALFPCFSKTGGLDTSVEGADYGGRLWRL
jgi:hypothetical protein